MSAAALLLLCPLTVPGAVVVDGFFAEWKEMDAAGLRLGGSAGALPGPGDGADLTVELRCARDGRQIHLVVGVRDDRFTLADTVKLTLGDGVQAVIDPGDLEERPPRITGLPGATVDGATRPGGWILEVGIPEAPLHGKGWTPAGIAASIEVVDDDAELEGASLIEPLQIRFPTGAANLQAWLHEAAASRFDHAALLNIGGDDRPEWVLAVGNVLGVVGEGLGDVGMSGDVLPWSDQGRVVALRGEDLDGDGTDELWVEQRLTTGDVSQTVLYLYDWEDHGLTRLLGLETDNKGPGWKVANRLTVRRAKPKGRWAKLQVMAGRAKGVRETSYKDVDVGLDLPYQPLLLPWGFAKKATYEYESGRYLRVLKD